MRTIAQLQQLLNTALAQVQLPATPAELYDPIRYALAMGGKRLRPTLTLAACEMFGSDLQYALNPAIGLELFHNFTLLHDDIMDNAPLRRGEQTVFKKWNANIAILSGDTMFALANGYMVRTRPDCIATVVELFNRTAIEVCEGQQWDMNFETPPEVSLHEYLAMIRLKTAVLLAASLKTGAIVAGAPPAEAEILYQAGINAGLAFQLEDDLLDVYGHQEKFGKVSGGDIAACKKTYLYLKSLEVAGSRKAELIEIYNSRNSDVKTKIEKVKAAYDAYGIRMITRQEIQRYCAKAIGLISSLNLPEENKALPGDFIVSLVGREH